MKKRMTLIFLLLALLLVATMVLGGVALGKYVTSLRDEKNTVTASRFYFRSNVLDDAAIPLCVEVLGKSTEFVLVNAQDSSAVAAEEITYTVTYSVLVSGEGESEVWERKEDMAFTATLAGGAYSTQSVTASPIVWDRDADGVPETYNNVLVEAKATAPYEKTLRARFDFRYSAMAISYAYDRELGMITMMLSTNDDAGAYLISWTPGLLPDNADPNGILTSARKTEAVCGECGHVYDETVGDPDNGIAAGTVVGALPSGFTCPDCGAAKAAFLGRTTAALEAHTVYRLHFFVPVEARPQIDSQVDALLESQGEDAVLQLAAQNVTCIPYGSVTGN